MNVTAPKNMERCGKEALSLGIWLGSSQFRLPKEKETERGKK